MAGPDNKGSGKERGGSVLTALVVGVLFFAGGIMLGLSVGLLLLILLVTAVVTVGVFVFG